MSTNNQKLKAYRAGFFVLLALLIATANYDYLVFKTLIVNYMPEAALEELYSRHLREENRRGFRRDFNRVVISAVTAELAAIANDRHTYLYHPGEFQAALETDREIAREAKIRPISPNTAHLYLPNISRRTANFVHDQREYLAGFDNLVLDLRGNYGGWLPAFHDIAGLFVPSGAVLSREKARLPLLSRAVTSNTPAYFDFEKIIILQDNRTASSAEALILALTEHLPNVTTVGQTTFGKGMGQVTIPLTGRYALRATLLQIDGPAGQNIHGKGIPPKIQI